MNSGLGFGRTNEGGVLTLPDNQCRSASTIEVSADLFVATQGRITEEDPEPHRIVLDAACQQVFIGQDLSGGAVGDFGVWMSRAVLPLDLEAVLPGRREEPAGPAEFSIHGSLAGPAGECVVRNLSPGKYTMLLAVPDRSIVGVVAHKEAAAEPQDVTMVMVPGEPITLVIASIYVFAIQASGDSIVSHSFSFDTADWLLGEIAEPTLKLKKLELEAAFPEAAIALALPRKPIGECRPPRARCTLRRKGEVSVNVVAVPLQEFSGPEIIDSRTLAENPLLSAQVHVYDSTGQKMHARDFVLVQGESLTSGPWFFPDDHGSFAVPAGEYGLFTTRHWLQQTFRPVRLVPPASTEVYLEVPVRRCVFDCRLPWGESADRVRWIVDTPLGRLFFAQCGPQEPKPLPVGMQRVTAEVFGLPATSAVVEVPQGAIDDIFVIRVNVEAD